MKYSYSKMGSYLYSQLPHYHKVMDEQNELLLKRFMEVFNVGFTLNDSNLQKALEKTQASKCDEEDLEELAKSMGADWISTIAPQYQRTIVRMLIKLYKQKGTIDTIRFIASELSGFEAKIIEGEIPSEYCEPGDEKKRLLTIKLQAPELDDPIQAQQHETTIAEVISNFVPVHTKFILVITYFYEEPYYRRIRYEDGVSLDQDFGVVDVDISTVEEENNSITQFHAYTTNLNIIGTQQDVIAYSKFNQDLGNYNSCSTSNTTHSFTSKIGTLDSFETEINTYYTNLDKVVLKYEVEAPTKDLGINTKVFRTVSTTCVTTNKAVRLSKPSYVDVIRVQGAIQQIRYD